MTAINLTFVKNEFDFDVYERVLRWMIEIPRYLFANLYVIIRINFINKIYTLLPIFIS